MEKIKQKKNKRLNKMTKKYELKLFINTKKKEFCNLITT